MRPESGDERVAAEEFYLNMCIKCLCHCGQCVSDQGSCTACNRPVALQVHAAGAPDGSCVLPEQSSYTAAHGACWWLEPRILLHCRRDLGVDERSETAQYALQQLLGLAGVLKVGSARYLWLQPLGHLYILLSW